MSFTLPKPSPSTVAALTEPWWQRRSTWTGVGAVLLELPNLVDFWTPILTSKQAMALHAFAVTLAAITGILARIGGVAAAGRVAEIAVPVPAIDVAPGAVSKP